MTDDRFPGGVSPPGNANWLDTLRREEMAARPRSDWVAMEHAYRKTDASVASILRDFEVTRSAFDDHRKRCGWLREHPNANGPASVRAAAAPLVVGVADNGQVLTEPDDGWTVSGVNDTQTISDPLYDRSIVSAASGLLDDDKDRRIAALEA